VKLDSSETKPFFIKTDNPTYKGMQHQPARLKSYFTRHTRKISRNHL